MDMESNIYNGVFRPGETGKEVGKKGNPNEQPFWQLHTATTILGESSCRAGLYIYILFIQAYDWVDADIH